MTTSMSAYDAGAVPVLTIQQRLRIARENARLDQTALAGLIGIAKTSVSNAESGRHQPRKIVLNAWAMATGVPVTWLATGRAPGSAVDVIDAEVIDAAAPVGGEGDGKLSHLSESNRRPFHYKSGHSARINTPSDLRHARPASVFSGAGNHPSNRGRARGARPKLIMIAAPAAPAVAVLESLTTRRGA